MKGKQTCHIPDLLDSNATSSPSASPHCMWVEHNPPKITWNLRQNIFCLFAMYKVS